jgi:hypothetical protein
MREPLDFREMELLCLHRASFDHEHRRKWLRDARRWKVLLHCDVARRFDTALPSPMTLGRNTVRNERQERLALKQLDRRKSPLE